MNSKIFGKIKEVFRKQPEANKTPSGSFDPSIKTSITIGDVISDEFKQIKRKVILGNLQAFTEDEILREILEPNHLSELYTDLEKIPQISDPDSQNQASFSYFRSNNLSSSKNPFQTISSNEIIDLGSSEVLDFLKVSTKPIQQENSQPFFCLAAFGTYDEKKREHIFYNGEDSELTNEFKSSFEKELLTRGVVDFDSNIQEDYFYFILRGKDPETSAQKKPNLLYGVSFFKQFPRKGELKGLYPNVTKPFIQKTFCIISRTPAFQWIADTFKSFVCNYLDQNQWTDTQNFQKMIEESKSLFARMPSDLTQQMESLSSKKIFVYFKEKALIAWKALFLEKRILVYSSRPSASSNFIFSLLSLFPCASSFHHSSKSSEFLENHFQEYGLPLKLFHEKCLFSPYFGVQHLDEIAATQGFLLGTSNFLMKTLGKVSWDILIDLDKGAINFKNESLNKILVPTNIEKELIHTILEKVRNNNLKHETRWSDLVERDFRDQEDTSQFEGTDVWVRQKISNFITRFFTEFEFFRKNVFDSELKEIVHKYNLYNEKIDKESELRQSLNKILLRKGSENDQTESESEISEQKEEGKTDTQDKKESTEDPLEENKENKENDENDPKFLLKRKLDMIKKNIDILNCYGVGWISEWVKTENFKIWTMERKNSIYERSIICPSAKNHLWIYEHGDIYFGDLIYGKKEGNGQYLYRHSQLIYQGEWRKNQRSGRGSLRSVWGNDFLYDGDWKADKKNGFGRLVQRDEKYTGNFVNDLYQGAGLLVDSEKNMYEGEFKNGEKWGMGKLQNAVGDIYKGEFVEGQFEGQGQYISKDGEIYSGGFSQGKKSGYGILQTNIGDIYEGEFRNDNLEGLGIIKRTDGHKFELEFSEGKPVDGKLGRIHYPDRSRYEGIIVDLKSNGQGTLFLPEDETVRQVKGTFDNGKLVEQLETNPEEKKNLEEASEKEVQTTEIQK